jgi:hypothetical protein
MNIKLLRATLKLFGMKTTGNKENLRKRLCRKLHITYTTELPPSKPRKPLMEVIDLMVQAAWHIDTKLVQATGYGRSRLFEFKKLILNGFMPNTKTGRQYRVPPELYKDLKAMLAAEALEAGQWEGIVQKYALLFHRQGPNAGKKFVPLSKSSLWRLDKKLDVVDQKTDWTTEARELAVKDLHTYTTLFAALEALKRLYGEEDPEHRDTHVRMSSESIVDFRNRRAKPCTLAVLRLVLFSRPWSVSRQGTVQSKLGSRSSLSSKTLYWKHIIDPVLNCDLPELRRKDAHQILLCDGPKAVGVPEGF